MAKDLRPSNETTKTEIQQTTNSQEEKITHTIHCRIMATLPKLNYQLGSMSPQINEKRLEKLRDITSLIKPLVSAPASRRTSLSRHSRDSRGSNNCVVDR